MGHKYLYLIVSLVWMTNNSCGFPARTPSTSLVSCTQAEEDVAKTCGSLELSDILSSQTFTVQIGIGKMSMMYLPVIAMVNSKDGALGKGAEGYVQSQVSQNMSSISSLHIDCQLYERYTQCVDEHGITDKCFSNEDFITRASYGYICGVGREDYLQSAICLEKMNDYALRHQTVAKAECSQNAVNMVNAMYTMIANYKATTVEQLLIDQLDIQKNILCLIREDIHSCTGPWVRRQCGKMAESLAHGMVEHVIKSLVELYQRVDHTFEVLSICTEQAVPNVPQIGTSQSYIDQLLQYVQFAVVASRQILGKCSSLEEVYIFVICGCQVLKESPTSTLVGNSGSVVNWFEQACLGGLERFQSCVDSKQESCPTGGYVNDIYEIIKAECALFAKMEPECYLPAVDYTQSGCNFNIEVIAAWVETMLRQNIDSDGHIGTSRLGDTVMQEYRSLQCIFEYHKKIIMSSLPKECGPKLKYDVQHVFDLIEKLVGAIPEFVNTTLEEVQEFLHHLKPISPSDTAQSMVQKCGGHDLINYFDENSLLGTLLHILRLQDFHNIIAPQKPASSSDGLHQQITKKSLLRSPHNDIFLDSAIIGDTVSSTSVEKACQKYEAYQQCCGKMCKNVDPDGGPLTDSQIMYSWGYLCGKGKQDLMLSVNCLVELDVSAMEGWMNGAEGETCRATRWKYVDGLSSTSPDLMCRARAFAAACIEAMAESKCGLHAGHFIEGLMGSIFEGFVANSNSIGPPVKPSNDCL